MNIPNAVAYLSSQDNKIGNAFKEFENKMLSDISVTFPFHIYTQAYPAQ